MFEQWIVSTLFLKKLIENLFCKKKGVIQKRRNKQYAENRGIEQKDKRRNNNKMRKLLNPGTASFV